jgi:hypothetical protein
VDVALLSVLLTLGFVGVVQLSFSVYVRHTCEVVAD